MWHLKWQAGLVALGTTGLGFLQSVAGGFDPSADAIVIWVISHTGWPFLFIGYGGATVLFAHDLWRRFRPPPTNARVPSSSPWIGIKAAVDYIRGESGWKTEAVGEDWSGDLDRDIRNAFGKMFGPRTRGREYSLLSSGRRKSESPVRNIARNFWPGARFDREQIRMTPARLVARNEGQKRLFDEIEVERRALERAFPRPAKTVHVPSPPNLRECFTRDFPNYLKRDGAVPVQDGRVRFDIGVQVHEDYTAHSKFVSFYIPHIHGHPHNYTKAACDYLAANLQTIVDELHGSDGLKVEVQLAGDSTNTPQDRLKFSGAVFIYHEGPLTHVEMGEIEQRFKQLGGTVKLRGASYANAKSLQERATSEVR